MPKRNQPERAQRLAFMQWVRLKPLVRKHLIAIENGGTRNLLEAANIKRCGLVAGTPDYFLMVPRGKYHGLWLEFKAGKNKLTKKQQQFFESASKQCYKCEVVWDSIEAINLLENYLREQ